MSVLDSYINILYRALKPRESKRLQAAGQWSKGALGGVPSFVSLRSKPLNFGPDGHHSSAFSIPRHCACGQRSGEGNSARASLGRWYFLLALRHAVCNRILLNGRTVTRIVGAYVEQSLQSRSRACVRFLSYLLFPDSKGVAQKRD
jgi:hypothetical protein